MKKYSYETIEFNLDVEGKPRSYVKENESSSKTFDFSNKMTTNEIMKYEIVSKMLTSLPKKDESLFLITTKPVSLLDILNFIDNKEKITEVIIFIFTINAKGANYLLSLSERIKFNIIISDIMNTKREKEFLIIEILKKGIDFVFCNSHAKILSVKTENNYYNLSGSMNSGSNQKIENLHISNSKPIFEFIKSTYFELKNKCTIKPRHDGIQ